MPLLNSIHSPTGPTQSPYTPDTSSTPTSAFGSQPHTNGLLNSHVDQSAHRGSGDFDDSRRSSVSNSIHQGMNNLGLGPASPYASNNHSQTSILQRERGIQPNGYPSSRYSTLSNGPLSPFNARNSRNGGFAAGRVAPPILENPKQEVYSAEAPTRGQAYAFPDPDARPGRPPSTFSRRNSFAESFTSSIMTIESSRLPVGQHGKPPEIYSVKLSDQVDLPDTHHHTLVNKQIHDLRQEPDSPNSATPYSRTPELRVTHKLAERKRRSEMKDCFEQLRARLPASQNNKSSKWETLSRGKLHHSTIPNRIILTWIAIAIDYITSLENQVKQSRVDIEKHRHQLQDQDLKIQELTQQLHRLQHQGTYSSPTNAMPQSPLGYASNYTNGIDKSNEPVRTLPPLMNGAMQGVQYSDDRR